MAIEAKRFTSLSEEDRAFVEQLEREIDGFLEREYTGDGTIAYDLQQKLKVGVREELIRRYKQAGWSSVEYYILSGGAPRMNFKM